MQCICISGILSTFRSTIIISGWSLHLKWSFPSRISSINVTKSAVSCEFSHIYWSFGKNFIFRAVGIAFFKTHRVRCPAGMDATQMHLWVVSYSVSEISQRGLICKSLRRLPEDWLETSPQRRLWDLSDFLRDVFCETVILGLETKGSFWLPGYRSMSL